MPTNVRIRTFGVSPDGRGVSLYALDNGRGVRVGVIELGADIVRVQAPHLHGTTADVVLDLADVVRISTTPVTSAGWSDAMIRSPDHVDAAVAIALTVAAASSNAIVVLRCRAPRSCRFDRGRP